MLVLHLSRKEEIVRLAFSPVGGMLTASSDRGVSLWRDLADGARAVDLGRAHSPPYAQFSADGRYLLTGTYQLSRFELATGDWVSTPHVTGQYVRFGVSPVEAVVLLAQSAYGAKTCQLSLRRTDDVVSVGGKVWEREFPASNLPPQFLAGGDRFAQIEGGWFAVRGNEGRAVTYAAATGERVGTSGKINYGFGGIVLAPDGSRLLVYDTNHIDVYPLTADAGMQVRVRNDGRKHFTSVAFHPSGRYIAATSNDATVKLYDTTNWREARAFTWQLGRLRSVCFSPDGTLAAAGSDKGQVVVWDVDL